MTLFREFNRRNVFKVATVYLFTGWLILQIISVITPYLNLPILFGTIVTVVLALGFPVACIFAWAFDLTPEGMKLTKIIEQDPSVQRKTNYKWNILLVSFLLLAVTFIGYREFGDSNDPQEALVSIAVLPFEDFSSNRKLAYLGEGIADTILNDLVNLNEFQVAARTSSFAYQKQKLSIADIGQKLNVDMVLEGSLQENNGQLRVIAQLIRVSDEAHIWSKTLSLTNDNIFYVQDSISREVVALLAPSVEVADKVKENIDPRAYEYFLQGQRLFSELNFKSMPEALEYFKKAVKLQPDYMSAHAHLAVTYFMNLELQYSNLEYKTAFDKAQRHILQVNLSAHSTLRDKAIANAALAFFSGEVDLGAKSFKEATNLQTATEFELSLLGRLVNATSPTEETLDFYNKLLEMNDNLLEIKRRKVQTLALLGQFEKAEKLLREYISQHPEFETYLYELALVIESSSTSSNKRVLEAYKAVFNHAITHPESFTQSIVAIIHLPLFTEAEQNEDAWAFVRNLQEKLQIGLLQDGSHGSSYNAKDTPYTSCWLSIGISCSGNNYHKILQDLNQKLITSYSADLRTIGLKENLYDRWRPINSMVTGAILLKALHKNEQADKLISKINRLVNENDTRNWVGVIDPFFKAKLLAVQGKSGAIAELESVVERGFIASIRFLNETEPLITDHIVWDQYRGTSEFQRIETKVKQQHQLYKKELAPLVTEYLSKAKMVLARLP